MTNDLPDATDTEDIRSMMEGFRRTKPARGVRPLFVQDARRILGVLGDSPYDRRDYLSILLVHLGPLNCQQIADLTFEDCDLQDDGLVCTVEGRDIFIGGVDDPALDIRIGFAQYLATIPWRSGRLMRAVDNRGGWFDHASRGSIAAGVRRACRLAGVKVKSPTRALQKGFIIRAVEGFGVIITAHHIGKTTAAVARHSPTAKRIERAVSRRRREEAPAGPRGPRKRRESPSSV